MDDPSEGNVPSGTSFSPHALDDLLVFNGVMEFLELYEEIFVTFPCYRK
jgi:hypothetical protein